MNKNLRYGNDVNVIKSFRHQNSNGVIDFDGFKNKKRKCHGKYVVLSILKIFKICLMLCKVISEFNTQLKNLENLTCLKKNLVKLKLGL